MSASGKICEECIEQIAARILDYLLSKSGIKILEGASDGTIAKEIGADPNVVTKILEAPRRKHHTVGWSD